MRAKNYDFLRKNTKTEKNKKPPDQPTKRLYKRFYVVEVTRLELAASASRTQRSTKLSHTSNYRYGGKMPPFFGCPTRIRTQTNRVRVCRATITQSGNNGAVLETALSL